MFNISEQKIFSLEKTTLDLYGIPVEKHWHYLLNVIRTSKNPFIFYLNYIQI